MCLTGKRQGACGCSTTAAGETATLWAPHPAPAVSAGGGQEATVTLGPGTWLSPNGHHCSNKLNNPPRKIPESECSTVPRNPALFQAVAEWGCKSPTPGCRTVALHSQQGWWGKEGKGGRRCLLGIKSLWANPSHWTPKHTCLKPCAANPHKYCLFLLCSEIMPTSPEGWDWRQHSQPKHDRCRHAVATSLNLLLEVQK